ncbi:YiiX/YebB-like N1pC/P60 family cysteine hydrolase, partial [Escherichia coli]
MNINYPAEYEIGDIVFTCIGAALFGQISAASNCWSNHVGIIIGHNGEDGFAPIFPDTCYHLTHYWPAAADIPV